jgi:serine/threonine protein kinase
MQANVLVDHDGRARITDFGLAVIMYATATATSPSSLAGSANWMAPELLNPEQFSSEVDAQDAGRPTKNSDVYSLAMTTWEVRRFRSLFLVCTDVGLDI